MIPARIRSWREFCLKSFIYIFFLSQKFFIFRPKLSFLVSVSQTFMIWDPFFWGWGENHLILHFELHFELCDVGDCLPWWVAQPRPVISFRLYVLKMLHFLCGGQKNCMKKFGDHKNVFNKALQAKCDNTYNGKCKYLLLVMGASEYKKVVKQCCLTEKK